MRGLLLAWCALLVGGARPSMQANSLDADTRPNAFRCPNNELARTALQKLGLESDKLPEDLCTHPSVGCEDCRVVRLELKAWLNGTMEAFQAVDSVSPFTALRRLSLKGSALSGDLRSLVNLTALEVMDLSGTAVSGNITSLSGLRKLISLQLKKTQVEGDVGSLSPLTALRWLTLAKSGVSGDVQSLATLTALEELRIAKCKISGNVEGLSKMRNLRQLSMSFTKVGGDISSFKTLTSLEIMYAEKTRISGDVKALSSLKALERLSFERSSVFGDVRVFSALPIADLWLKQTKVSGDIGSLSNLTSLKNLRLDSTKVTGDITGVSKLSKLKILSLDHVKVTGHLNALSGLSALKEIFLRSTGVQGDVNALENLTKLQRVYLERTNISGQLASFQNLKDLGQLSIEKAQFAGDVSHLRKLKHLQLLYASRTQISGDIASLSGLVMLEKLFLRGTKVRGDVKSLGQMQFLKRLLATDTDVSGDLKGLKKLRNLEVIYMKHTKLSGDIRALGEMTNLRQLWLAGTNVSGDLGELVKLEKLTEADLSKTLVTGRLTTSWRGCCKRLRTLKLSESKVRLLPQDADLKDLRFLYNAKRPNQTLLPSLMTLEVSGCPLGGRLEDLLEPLAASPHLTKIKAERCNLTGTVVHLKYMEAVSLNDVVWSRWQTDLSKSLQILDVAYNNITEVQGLPAQVFNNLANNGLIRLAPGLLSTGQVVNLLGTPLADHSEVRKLLAKGHLKRTAEIRQTDEQRGFACYGIDSSVLQVSPELFLPERLCGCLAGWAGAGVSCQACPTGTFNAHFNSSVCTACPENSTSTSGASSVDMCICDFGKVYSLGSASSESSYACGCPKGQALYEGACVTCTQLHLNCSVPGSVATSAPPLRGWARIEDEDSLVHTARCIEPAESRCSLGQCTPGYAGPLCVVCAPHFRSAGSLCAPCAAETAALRPAALAAAGLLALGAAAGVAWRRRQASELTEPNSPSARDAALALLAVQAPLLLQLGQLWVVVASLAATPHSLETKEEEATERSFAVDFFEQPYVQWLQLSAQGLQDALSLECSYGASARSAAAVAAPLAPLALLALCGAVEVVARSSGIGLALKVLTLFFVGGAAGCGKLLSCQDLDGGGEPLGAQAAFRVAMPFLLCSEPSWVDVVGGLCAVAYGVLIPAFLLALMVKQHVTLQSSRRIAASAIEQGDKLLIRLHEFRSSDQYAEKDRMFEKNLLAAAISHAAVLFRGTVRMQMQNGAITLAAEDTRTKLDAKGKLSDMLEIKNSADAQRCNAITRMLMERCILEEAEPSDRVLAGAHGLLCKYVWCQDVWVEIVLRLATVALVAAAPTEHGLGFSVGFCVLVGVLVGTLQPYAQRQVNDLQCCCFLCLGVAAMGFGLRLIWLARAALAVPVVLLCCQVRSPDCPEALALRLFKALEPQLGKLQEEISVQVEELSL